jgi:CDGSH-type Zn-finger protein/uncharacterized Fe-S cluster protein YjdI
VSKIKVYKGEGIAVHFDASRCIHAAECVHGLPAVFDPQARPWIQADKATAAELAAVVAKCPSGALQAQNDDATTAEAVPERAELRIVADGPHFVRGRIEIRDAGGSTVAHETRMALCRCGASTNKPYCDNSHAGAGFKDDGVPSPGDIEQLAPGPLTLTLCADGPVQCDGPLDIVDAFGERVAATQQSWLCRCGASKNKPYCDGSHKSIGFRA